ncbi:MAG TPA: selenocysteine-specific translation elongation factor [Bryobacteraceae bacterium]|nr:selenocysteine-specific translation elongation factor [Bryobacteraceae bacterium]
MRDIIPRNIIVGTAGHIDHGKTALVKALTGTDADRLAEEKRRGITIDLGFASQQIAPDLRLGFIDVPGHERFVRNMLAGAAGIDLVLFVISAAESIKPQTREHFEICRLLGVQAGVVALTKSDLVDADLLELVRMEVDEFLAGSFLEKAPRVAVSSTSGAGIPELREELEKAARKVREKSAGGWFRLPIDRAFTMKGFGTVVTGTMISGTLQREQEVELFPAGRRLRVRGIQVYGEAADRARAGERTAVNLAGIEPSELHRGMVLTDAGCFAPVTRLDCRLDLLSSAKPLKNRAPVHFHAGTAEIEAEVRYLDRRTTLKPGEFTWARIVLKEPALILPGDHFIIRMFSPVVTIGGGVVTDISGHRYRKTDDPDARLKALRPQFLIAERPYGLTVEQLIAWTGMHAVPEYPGIEAAGKYRIASDRVADLRQQLTAACRAFHKEKSLLPGILKQDLKARVMPRAPVEIFEYALSAASELTQDAEVVRLKTHRVVLKQDETEARAAIETAFEKSGLAAPAVAEVLKASGVENSRARSILQILLREGRLVRISDELVLHADAVAKLHATLADKNGQRFAVPDFKDWTGVSRKYAIPLLEYLDREHVTRREGDERVVVHIPKR